MKTNWTVNTKINTTVQDKENYLKSSMIVVDCKIDYKITSERTYKDGNTKYYITSVEHFTHPIQGLINQKNSIGYQTLEQLQNHYNY